MTLAPTDDERMIEAIRYRSAFSPTHHQIGRIIAMIENGDMILVNQIPEHLRETVRQGNDLPTGFVMVDALSRKILDDYEAICTVESLLNAGKSQ
jgi:hypothetical protein